MGVAAPGVRNLFRAALLLLVITVVTGVLNGIDLWDPPRNTLLTHVHAGTLGWITLAVIGGAIWLDGTEDHRTSATLASVPVGGGTET